jgi:hypothetical protein
MEAKINPNKKKIHWTKLYVCNNLNL